MSVVVAGCKVNLGLRITGVRENGYHELDSLFWPLPRPCDRLHIRETGAAGLTVLCDTPGIDLENNTLTKAYAALAKRVPDLPEAQVLAAAAAMRRPCCAGSTAGYPARLTIRRWQRLPSLLARTLRFFLSTNPAGCGALASSSSLAGMMRLQAYTLFWYAPKFMLPPPRHTPIMTPRSRPQTRFLGKIA